jgi:hypothetical protein
LTPTSTTPPQPTKATSGKIGQTIIKNGHSLTVTKLEKAKTYEHNSQPYEAYEGAQFVFIEVSFVAGSMADIEDTRNALAIIQDNEGFMYPKLTKLDGRSPAFGETSNKLNAKDTSSGWITFQIPESAKGLIVRFNISNGVAVFPDFTNFSVALDDDPHPVRVPAQPIGTIGKVGQIVGDKGYAMQLTKVEIAGQVEISPHLIVKAQKDKQFVSVELIFESLAENGILVTGRGSLKDSAGVKYDDAGGRSQLPRLTAIFYNDPEKLDDERSFCKVYTDDHDNT